MVKSWFGRATVVTAAALGVGATSCVVEDKTTQITVAITSEAEIPREVNNIQVTVTDAHGSTRYKQTQPVSTQRFFPTTIALIPHDKSSLDGPVQVEINALLREKEGGPFTSVVLRKATLSYVEGRTLLVPMALRMACFHIGECKANETCAGGMCRSAQLDAAKLDDYSDKLVFGSAEGANCFDEDMCLRDVQKIEVSPPDCSFTLPSNAEGATPNIAIEWAAAENRVIVLDADDDVEGFSFDVGSGSWKLSRGVCDALLKESVPNKALKAYYSTSCPAKRKNQPICGDGIGYDFRMLPP